MLNEFFHASFGIKVGCSKSALGWTGDRIESARNFANKIWNAARFLFVNLDKFEQSGAKIE